MRKNWKRPRDRRGRFCRPGAEGAVIVRLADWPRRAAKIWPKEQEAIFFRELGIVCDLDRALAAAHLSDLAAEVPERLRTDPAFRAKWNAALAAGYALLDLEMLGRARFGEKRAGPKTEAQKKLRSLPNSLALQLLRLYHARIKGDPAAAGTPPVRPLPNAREIRKRLDAKLSEFNRLMGGEG